MRSRVDEEHVTRHSEVSDNGGSEAPFDDGGNQDSCRLFRSNCKVKADKKKLLKTAILNSGVLCLGMQWGVIGPTLPDVVLMTGSSTSVISLILTGRNVAAVFGNIAGGVLIDRYNNWLLLSVALFFMGSLLIASLWPGNIIGLAVFLIPAGFAAGCYDTGVNVAVMRVWIKGTGPWTQGMEFVDAIGSCVAPSIVEPFLAGNANSTWSASTNGGDTDNVTWSISANGTNGIAWSTPNHSFGGWDHSGKQQGNNTNYNNLPFRESMFANYSHSSILTTEATTGVHTRIFYAYLIVGLLLIVSSLLHLFVFIAENGSLRILSKRQTVSKSDTRVPAQRSTSKVCLYVLLPLFCCSYCSLESGYAHYLMTFSLEYLKWNKSQGIALTSAFWGASAVGTAVGIIAVKYVRPSVLLFLDVTLCVISQLALLFFTDLHPGVLWTCVVVVGVSLSTVFAAVFTWALLHVGMSGRINSLLTMGTSFGDMTAPAVIGVLFDKAGPASWLYCMLAAAITTLTILIVMQLVGSKVAKEKACSLIISENDVEAKLNHVTHSNGHVVHDNGYVAATKSDMDVDTESSDTYFRN